MLAADAWIAGRSLRNWDREGLMRDVLARERERWTNRGVTAPYENLLALATIVGDLRYWATLISVGVRRYAIDGNVPAALALFKELDELDPGELRRIEGTGGFIRTGLYLLPVLTKDGHHREAENLKAADILRRNQGVH